MHYHLGLYTLYRTFKEIFETAQPPYNSIPPT